MLPLLLLATLLQTPPAAASEAPAKAPSPPAVKAAQTDPVECRNDSATGHRIATRVCHTHSEWVRMERSASDYFATRPGSSCDRGITKC